jgi:hypothetical protein
MSLEVKRRSINYNRSNLIFPCSGWYIVEARRRAMYAIILKFRIGLLLGIACSLLSGNFVLFSGLLAVR